MAISLTRRLDSDRRAVALSTTGAASLLGSVDATECDGTPLAKETRPSGHCCEIRGSNSQHLDIRAGGFGFFDRMIDDRMMEKWIGCSAAMGKPDDLRFARKARGIQRSAAIHEEWGFFNHE